MNKQPTTNAVIGSLLRCLQDHRFELVATDTVRGSGSTSLTGTPRQHRQQAKKIIRYWPLSYLYLSHPDTSENLMVHVGNRDGRIEVTDTADFLPLSLALQQFRKKNQHQTTSHPDREKVKVETLSNLLQACRLAGATYHNSDPEPTITFADRTVVTVSDLGTAWQLSWSGADSAASYLVSKTLSPREIIVVLLQVWVICAKRACDRDASL